MERNLHGGHGRRPRQSLALALLAACPGVTCGVRPAGCRSNSTLPHRGALCVTNALRSRTYIGIAAAMALQWMPTLIGYCKMGVSRTKTVGEMLHAARLSLALAASPAASQTTSH
eukprot:scaffold27973_cov107-Isochrysis_galbana.AAC.1